MFTVCTEAESTPCSTTVMVLVQPRSPPILCRGHKAGFHFHVFVIGKTFVTSLARNRTCDPLVSGRCATMGVDSSHSYFSRFLRDFMILTQIEQSFPQKVATHCTELR